MRRCRRKRDCLCRIEDGKQNTAASDWAALEFDDKLGRVIAVIRSSPHMRAALETPRSENGRWKKRKPRKGYWQKRPA